MSKTRGLILGKFAPFHVGHKRLVQTAIKEVDEVYILIYDCPDLTSIPLNIRANWVRRLFPKVHVIEGWDAPNKHANNNTVKKMQEEYVQKVLKGKKITHFFSSEYYGEHMSKALGAIDRRLDRFDPRQKYTTSASMIRSGKNLNQNFLDFVVYKDILIKIAFVGLPSLEQSDLIVDIAKYMKTCYIKDNTLELFAQKQIKYDKRLTPKIDFYKLATSKYKLANSRKTIFSASKYLIYNSTGFVDHLLTMATHSKFEKNNFDLFAEDMKKYDLVFVNNNPKNGIAKYLNIDDKIFTNQLIKNLNTLNIQYEKISGTFEEKRTRAIKLIKLYKERFYYE